MSLLFWRKSVGGNDVSVAVTTTDPLPVVGAAGTALIGKVGIDQATANANEVVVKSITAGDNNIGNVDIVTLPVANLGQRAMAASLSTVPASDIADATYIGDIKFGEELPAGTAVIGHVALRGKNVASADNEINAKVAMVDADVGIAVTLKTAAGKVVAAGGGDGNDGTYVSLLAPTVFNGLTWDRLRSIASSGAGLGVAKVGTLGELITLAASAARTESANGTAVTGLGWRNRYIILFDLTVADTDAGDTLDVYVDVSLDGSTWLNAVHFTQIIGTDSASKRFAVLDPAAPGTSEILVTADAAAGAVRPSMFGPQMRARWAITDAGTDDASFTFAITAYAI